MTLFGLLYDLGLHVYACASLPKMAKDFQKYKKSIWQKLGRHFPVIDKQERQLIWIHAVSLGETKAISPLIRKIKSLENPPLVLLSTTTQTGHAEGCKSAPMADFHVYLPFDFSYIIRPIVKRVSPDVVILTETDFWYHFQDAAKKAGAQLFLVNGKISERSFDRLHHLPFLSKRLINPMDHLYVQGELYKQRFEQLNIPSTKITVTGNLKLDSELESYDPDPLKKKLGITSQMVLTLGSTHDPEEKIWLQTLKKIWPLFPQLKVLLVPRHPERFQDVAKLLEQENISYGLWSEGGNFQSHQLVLVDAMGVLRKCYQISDIAFVGGSLTKRVGGHNILEPAFYGKPVLFGPHMHSQPDFLELSNTFQSGIQIKEETLFPTLCKWLTEPHLLAQYGENGKKLIEASKGALDATFLSLLPLLQKGASC